MGLFNGVGRIGWASFSDLIGRPAMYSIFFGIQIVAYFMLPGITNALLFQVLIFIILSCYGGGFATIPAWLTILLKYHTRTTDDFRSFVSFLNLSNSENVISNKNLGTILNGISEITLDASKQSMIVSKLIENKFKDVISRGDSNEEIEEKARNFAKTALEKRVEELESKTDVIGLKLENREKELEEREQEIITGSERTQKADYLSSQLLESLVDSEMKNRRNEGLRFLFLVLVLVILLVLCFIKREWNPMYHAVEILNSLPNDSFERDLAFGVLYGVLVGGLVLFFTLSYNRLFHAEKI